MFNEDVYLNCSEVDGHSCAQNIFHVLDVSQGEEIRQRVQFVNKRYKKIKSRIVKQRQAKHAYNKNQECGFLQIVFSEVCIE